jgi:hypothetical protein
MLTTTNNQLTAAGMRPNSIDKLSALFEGAQPISLSQVLQFTDLNTAMFAHHVFTGVTDELHDALTRKVLTHINQLVVCTSHHAGEARLIKGLADCYSHVNGLTPIVNGRTITGVYEVLRLSLTLGGKFQRDLSVLVLSAIAATDPNSGVSATQFAYALADLLDEVVRLTTIYDGVDAYEDYCAEFIKYFEGEVPC